MKFKNPTLMKSWGTAAAGFMTVIRYERKVRFALVVIAVLIPVAIYIQVSYLEFLFILFVWTQVIVGEIFNTSLEKAMDYASGKEFHLLIKRGKDYAAASVFVLSILATFITIFIFYKRMGH